jgi:hypothetical protein
MLMSMHWSVLLDTIVHGHGAHGRQEIAMHCETTCIAVYFLGDNIVSKLHKGTKRRTYSRTRSSLRRTANKERH